MNKLKTTMVTGALALSMMASVLGGCGNASEKIDGTKTAVTVNGEEVNVGVASMLLRYNQAHTIEMLESYGLSSTAGLWDREYAEEEDEDAIDYTGLSAETYGDGLKRDTINNIAEMVLLRQNAKEYDVTIPDAYQEELEIAAKYEAQYNEKLFEQIGITQDDVKELLELETYQKYVRDAMVADTDREVSDEEAKQRKLTYTRAWTTTTDDEGNETDLSEEEIGKLRSELEQLIDDINASDDPAKADMSELQKAIDEENLSTGTYAYGYDEDDTGMNEEVHKAVQTLKDGEVYDKVIESDGALFVVRLDAAVDPERTQYKKESIVSEREDENYKEKMEKIRKEAKVEVSDYWIDKITVTDKNSYVASQGEMPSEDSSSASEAVEGASAVVSSSSQKN